MKKTLTIAALALILVLSLLLTWQSQATRQHPVQLIRDMAQPAARPRLAPPAGTIPTAPARPARPAHQLFLNQCATCHGTSGNGQSYPAAYPGMPAVANLTTLRKTPAELNHSLLHGRGAMPAFRTRLNQTEADSLIHHIITHLQTK